MEELIVLVNLIRGSKFKSGGMLDILLEPGTHMRRLYDELASGKVSNDQDARRKVPELKSPARLATVKSKLKERLDEAILVLDFNESDSNDRQNAFITCSKKWATAGILLSKNARASAVQKLEQLLRHTKRFEFTELTVDVLRSLRLHASIITGDRQAFTEYNKQLQEYEAVRYMENQAEMLHTELMINFVNRKSEKKAMAAQAAEYFEIIEPYLQRTDSYRVQLFGRLMQITVYDNLNDYEKMVGLCQDAIAFFEQKPYSSLNAFQVFYYSLFMSYLNLQRYEDCRITAERYKSMFEPGRFNWFKWHELYFLAEMHAGRYTAAADIWKRVCSMPEFSELPPQVAEIWKIFEAYLYLLGLTGQLPGNNPAAGFKVTRFLNEFQVFTRDKNGMNISILVVQFMIQLAEGQLDVCIDREESLAKYRTRYLTPQDAGRSYFFIRMLESLPKASFHGEEVQRKTAPFFNELRLIPLEAANQNFEVEVIPYEALWDMALGLLTRKKAEA